MSAIPDSSNPREMSMSAFSFMAAAGLLGLVGGFVVANIASSPRAAQIGTVLAGVGVIMLAAVAVRHLLA
jgi:hypothetical protein